MRAWLFLLLAALLLGFGIGPICLHSNSVAKLCTNMQFEYHSPCTKSHKLNVSIAREFYSYYRHTDTDLGGGSWRIWEGEASSPHTPQ